MANEPWKYWGDSTWILNHSGPLVHPVLQALNSLQLFVIDNQQSLYTQFFLLRNDYVVEEHKSKEQTLVEI